MEFLLYLTPIGQELISKVMMKNYRVVENSAYCRNKEIFGGIQGSNFIICTNNIKNTISPVKHYVNETVYHEAVHVAQACKRGPLKIADATLDKYKLNDVARSLKVSNKSYPVYETEAYYLEDKPKRVLYYMKKYCF
jgi:aspartate ammonia-lyase